MKPMIERLKENEPYNIFFTTIPDSPSTYNQNSITFTDLLYPTLGKLKCSLQLNFIIDIDWLMEQYAAADQSKTPLTVIHGNDYLRCDMAEQILLYPNVSGHYVEIEDPFGIHHSKVGLYLYEDNSLRVVVSTANLYEPDWTRYCNGLWISSLCPPLPEGSSDKEGESPTLFKSTLANYLQQYKIEILEDWIKYVKHADFSNIKVFLTTSVPGTHSAVSRHCHLHTVGRLLSQHCVLPSTTNSIDDDASLWAIIAQSSSLGCYGIKAEWLCGTLLRSLASHKDCRLPSNSNAKINFIFPTENNVLRSYNKDNADGCLSYTEGLHQKQKWLENYLCQWKADESARTRSMPHTKMYCRVSPCLTQLAWFLITSANASKSAWGGNITKRGTIYVRSYEVGVLFLPKYFNETYFQIRSSDNQARLFPLIYDLPLTPYESTDEPWRE